MIAQTYEDIEHRAVKVGLGRVILDILMQIRRDHKDLKGNRITIEDSEKRLAFWANKEDSGKRPDKWGYGYTNIPGSIPDIETATPAFILFILFYKRLKEKEAYNKH